MSWRLLFLIAVFGAPGVHANDWIYTVQAGDNLWGLAAQYLIGQDYWHKLQVRNRISDPFHIPPGTQLHIPTRWLKNQPFLARVYSVSGTAEVIDGENGQISAMEPGKLLLTQDSVRTQENSSVVIEFADGSRLMLQPNSYLRVEHIGVYGGSGQTDTRARLLKGRLETQVAPKKGSVGRFEISTPSAATSVRGTDFRVASDETEATSYVEVVKGLVDVSGGGLTRPIKESFGTVAQTDSPPIPPTALLDPPDVATLPKVFERSPFQFPLSETGKVKGYRVQIYPRDHLLGSPLYDGVIKGFALRGPDLPDGDYTLRIRGIDGLGLEGLMSRHDYTLNARPEPPFLIKPEADAGVTSENPPFEWSRSETIKSYRFQLARDDDLAHPLVDQSNIGEAHYLSARKLDLDHYSWRVAASDEKEGLGPFSDWQTFRRIDPPPQAQEPEISDEHLVMRWRAGLPGQKYHVQLASDAEFANKLIDLQTAEVKLQIERPESGTYFMRVKTIESDGFVGAFGSPQIIDVPSDGYYWWLLALPLLGLIAL